MESLKQELRTHLYTDAKQVSQWVKDTFEVTYTPQGMADLLNRMRQFELNLEILNNYHI
ncbi:winged helix-turn-helix domain-containing protein [Capnocytophaga sp. oral taxon 878]|uniref:winged helix-turn-helix domain-containing protein n=1 Tax=Capnocytophaga sp. oral taxon 878 TaxID=1316596 RepID=UPI0020C5866F|nr:winged helix-turn-helix domain-containing protein [Capnocytophaga sp. oral taxon 878]